ncbi:cytochrome P450 [Auricularia subglabra TFB-10046 SS5]|nr:cytochrome P450 [Auricularia subglabra TFB-10046 SS5]
MGDLQYKACVALLLWIAVLAARRLGALKKRTQRLHFPPGPPRRWIVENLFDLPTGPEEWKKFAALGKRYGPVMNLKVLNRNIVVLSSFTAATDLLDKRSAIYSDRARFPMVGELMGFDWTVALQRYGDYWRLHRRAIHQHFNESASRELWPQLTKINAVFLQLLLQTPDRFWEHIRWLGGANIMSITYGMDSQLKDDPYIQLGEESLAIASKASSQGAYLVDVMPFLKYFPSWLPGMGFKRQAREWRALQFRARDSPHEFVKAQLAAGTARHSMTSNLLSSDFDGRPIPEDVIKNSAGMVYFAGADTSVVTMNSFVMAMVKHPDIQRKAQQEVDAFLESQGGRLPRIDDREAMPYVEGVLRECMRMYPPLPLGVVHRLMEDDEYEGMLIPANSLVISNAWAMLHDAAYYPSPHSFAPERYIGADGRIDPAVLDPRAICFGFGRRICPGRYFADAEVWLMLTSVLYCFDVSPAKGENGAGIMPNDVMCSGVVSALERFPCVVAARSSEKAALISAAV